MSVSEAKTKYNLEYAKKSLKRIPLDVQKEKYEEIKAAATAANDTVNGYIKKAIDEKMARDSAVNNYSIGIDHPDHYNLGDIECIDAMAAAYGIEAVRNFCVCNAFKYQWRFLQKNGIEDLKKCQWYQNKYIELCEGQ